MSKIEELMQVVAENLVVNIKTNDDGTFAVDADGFYIIEDEGHSLNSRPIREAVKKFFRDKYPDLHKKVEDHTKGTFYNATKRTPPFVVYMLAAGVITPERYVERILNAPHDATVVADVVEEKEFKDKLYEAYNIFREYSGVPVTSSGLKLTLPEGEKLKVLNTVMESYGLPSFTDVYKEFGALSSAGRQLEHLAEKLRQADDNMTKMAKEHAQAIANLIAENSRKVYDKVKVDASGEIPNGRIVMKKVKDVFPGVKANLEIPAWEWDGPHPDVPEIDNDYIFREDLLVEALLAVTKNKRMYLQGDTGSGKTTLIEQIAARLNWPFGRINFDSEITRMDLIGRDTLKDGKTQFVDGFLPKYLSGPYILCFDEIDFCRPDVAYVMQAALEGNGLVVTEDGGRRVLPHPMMRMFATGNTVGQGDEKGMYQGARPQSIALLDRFTVWTKVDYLSPGQRLDLLKKRVPTLTEDEYNTIIKYTTEHLQAFTDAKVLQPISPRGMISLGETLAYFKQLYPTKTNNIHKALTTVVLNRATQGDHAVLKGLVDRVAKT